MYIQNSIRWGTMAYFLPHYRHVLELVTSGEMGAIIALKADFGFVGNSDPKARIFSKALGGGSLLDISLRSLHLKSGTHRG